MRDVCATKPARRIARWSMLLPFVLLGFAAQAAEPSFPFDHELRLDATPQRGTKRIPSLQVAENGDVEIDLWCVSGKGQAAIADNTITIVPTSMSNNQCSPDQLQKDEALLADITQVTGWRRQGDLVVLNGPKTLRYRMSTN